MSTFRKAEAFIYRCARPLEVVRWRYHFENGPREDVLRVLSYYQNEDGGFGHGIEADNWNPASSPISTLDGIIVLNEIGMKDGGHPMIQGLLRYLDSGADFDAEHNQWWGSVPSNNDHPHAYWWGYDGKDAFQYNPTAGLTAFILRFAEPGSGLYKKGETIAREAVQWYLEKETFQEEHVAANFIGLYEAMKEKGLFLCDMEAFLEKLRSQVRMSICTDPEKWDKEYTARPSHFGITPESPFYEEFAELCLAECEFYRKKQLQDGSYPVTWKWWNDYPEFEAAKIRWQGVITLLNMRFMKAHGQVE